MTDRTERQKRDEATDSRDELVDATGLESDLDTDALGLGGGAATPAGASKPRRVARKHAAGKSARSTQQSTSDPEALRAAEAAERTSAVIELESQGFTEDEALRLFDISKRQEHTPEAQFTRQVRFMRWLVEQGRMGDVPG